MVVWCVMGKILCVIWKSRELNISFMVTWMINNRLYYQTSQAISLTMWQLFANKLHRILQFCIEFHCLFTYFCSCQMCVIYEILQTNCVPFVVFYHQEKQHYLIHLVYLYPDFINTYLLVVFLTSYSVRWHV